MNFKFLGLVSLAALSITAIPAIAQAGEIQNAITTNGLSLNGVRYNGLSLNGMRYNGLSLNGMRMNGTEVQNHTATSEQTGITLTHPEFSAIQVEGGRLVGVK